MSRNQAIENTLAFIPAFSPKEKEFLEGGDFIQTHFFLLARH